MSRKPWTPGPWYADQNMDYAERPRVHSDDRLICRVGNAEVDRQDQWEADARLIAAAPDMAEALEMCAAILPKYARSGRAPGDDEECEALIEEVNAALAIARGEA